MIMRLTPNSWVHQLLVIFFLISTQLVAFTQTPSVTFENASRLLDFEHRSSHFGGDGLAGAAWFDYNNDDLVDLFLTNGKTQPNALFRNNGDGTFINVAVAAGAESRTGNSGVVAADFDNDGWKDLFLTGDGGSLQGTAQAPMKLYHNNGDGTFSDITSDAELSSPVTHLAASVADINNDGYLDIFVSAPGSLAHLRNDRNKMYLNDGDLTFTDISASARVDTRVGACATMFSDYNNDGLMDLFVATCNDRNIASTPLELFRNNGDLTFTEVAAQAGVSRPGLWMGLAGSDYDHDGDIDIFVTNTGTSGLPHALWRNNGNGTFTDQAPAAGVSNHEFAWGCSFTDFDNDGNDDLFFTGSIVGTCPPRAATTAGAQRCLALNIIGPGVGNPGTMLFSNGDGGFTELTAQMPVNLSNFYTSGVAQADFDNNGFPDIIVAAEAIPAQAGRVGQPGRPFLLRNAGNGNNWLKVRLVGTRSNRDGVGAKVRVASNGVVQLREVYAGASHLSMGSQWLSFGLGQSDRVDSVTVQWPAGTIDILKNAVVNQIVTIEEGVTLTSVQEPGVVPGDFVLDQNYPNPFNPTTSIRYELRASSRVQLSVYNLIGEQVRVLVNETQTAGAKTVVWDGRDDSGIKLSSGLYIYEIQSDNLRESKKMLLLK